MAVRGYLTNCELDTSTTDAFKHTCKLVIGQLIVLRSRLEPCQTQQINVPGISILLQFTDLQSRLRAEVGDPSDRERAVPITTALAPQGRASRPGKRLQLMG